jgi:hypothetical protein
MKDSKTLWVFGDSWAWGWAGEGPTPHRFDNRYVNIFAKNLDITSIKDYSLPGSGMGQIAEYFLKQTINIKKDDIVFVTIPPDSRGYSSAGDFIQTIFHYDSNYKKLLELNNYSFYYFTYHLSLFIKMISDACYRIGAECIMQHNYSTLELLDWCNTDDFLDTEKSMWEWLNLPSNYTLYDFEKKDGPSMDYFIHDLNKSLTDLMDSVLIKLGENEYDLHPNENGHNIIANKLIELYKTKNNNLI